MLKTSSFRSYRRELMWNYPHWKVLMGVSPWSGVKVIPLYSSNGRWGFQSVWVHQSDTRFILRNVLWEWISCIKHPYPSWPRSCTYNPKWKKIKSCICINHVKEVTFWNGSDKIFSKKIYFWYFFICILREYKMGKKRARGEQNKNTTWIALTDNPPFFFSIFEMIF